MPRFEVKVSEREQDWSAQSAPLECAPPVTALDCAPPFVPAAPELSTLQSTPDTPEVAPGPKLTALQSGDTPELARSTPLQCDDTPELARRKR